MANIFNLENFTDFSEKINIDDLYEKKRLSDVNKLELYKKIIEGFNQGDTTDDDDEDKDDVGDEEFDEDIEGGDGCIECVNSDEECETEVDLCAKKVLLNDIGLEELENYYGSELEEEAYSYSDEE